jgi:hypothetical protein
MNKKINQQELIKVLQEADFPLQATLWEEYAKKDGNIDSWLMNIPMDLIRKYEDALEDLKEGETLLDSTLLSEHEVADLCGAAVVLLAFNNNNKGNSSEEVVETMKKIVTRMIPLVINEKVRIQSENSVGPLLEAVPDKKHPWDIDKGSVRLVKTCDQMSHVERNIRKPHE